MNFRILTPKTHGLLDYTAAVGLIVLPFLLRLSAASTLAIWLSVAAGIVLVGYSLATDYDFGLFGALSFRAHLVLDMLAAAGFVTAPFLFGWNGLVLAYYLVMGAGVLIVVALSATSESRSDSSSSVRWLETRRTPPRP